jgi:hypothetical protein
MINVSPYPQCARILHFQKCNLAEEAFTPYWAAINVASAQSDEQLTDFGGFNFRDQSDTNGRKLLKRLEEFLTQKAQRYAKNSVLASDTLKALLGSRGVKTSALKTEDDYWKAAETLFPGRIARNGGFTSLAVQIHSIPKKERKRLGAANLRNVPIEWISNASVHQQKLRGAA